MILIYFHNEKIVIHVELLGSVPMWFWKLYESLEERFMNRDSILSLNLYKGNRSTIWEIGRKMTLLRTTLTLLKVKLVVVTNIQPHFYLISIKCISFLPLFPINYSLRMFVHIPTHVNDLYKVAFAYIPIRVLSTQRPTLAHDIWIEFCLYHMRVHGRNNQILLKDIIFIDQRNVIKAYLLPQLEHLGYAGQGI